MSSIAKNWKKTKKQYGVAESCIILVTFRGIHRPTIFATSQHETIRRPKSRQAAFNEWTNENARMSRETVRNSRPKRLRLSLSLVTSSTTFGQQNASPCYRGRSNVTVLVPICRFWFFFYMIDFLSLTLSSYCFIGLSKRPCKITKPFELRE